MNATVRLLPYGKYLLLSGEISFGVTDLYSYCVGTNFPDTYYDTYTSVVQSASAVVGLNKTLVRGSAFSTAYNTITGKTDVLASTLRMSPPSAYSSPCVFLLTKTIQLVEGYSLACLATITIPFSPTEPAVANSQYVVSFPNNLMLSL